MTRTTIMSLRSIAFLCLTIINFLSYSTIDARKDSILEFLQLNADSQHELVEIEFSERLHKRAFSGETMPNGTRLRTRAFGQDVDLWLHPEDSLLIFDDIPIYFSYNSFREPGNVTIRQQFDLNQHLGRIFTDRRYWASLVIGTDVRGRRTVDGRIESMNLAIRSLPESVVNEYARKRRSIDGRDKHFSNMTYHVVYKTNGDSKNNYSLDAIDETVQHERVARTTSGIPYVIYPKILLVVDYSVYKKEAIYTNGFLKYLMAFVNGLDLKYRSLEAPRVRIHISGILVGAEPRGTPFISNNMIDGVDAFESDRSMEDARTFFYKMKDSIPKLPNYDIALTMTRLAFGSGKGSLAIGKGYPFSACQNFSYLGWMAAVGMFQDNGVFSGVGVAAHEMGHVLGMDDDEDQSDDCYYRNGFIMSFTPKYTTNSSSFSACSLKTLQKRLDNNRLKCMYEIPETHGRQSPKFMPGLLKDRDEQCSILGFGPACNVTGVDICVNLFCQKYNRCDETRVAALEGTRCNDENDILEKYCVHNRCVEVRTP